MKTLFSVFILQMKKPKSREVKFLTQSLTPKWGHIQDSYVKHHIRAVTKQSKQEDLA